MSGSRGNEGEEHVPAQAIRKDRKPIR
jgi:hypothetical protein